jgi:hypothetical protein
LNGRPTIGRTNRAISTSSRIVPLSLALFLPWCFLLVFN